MRFNSSENILRLIDAYYKVRIFNPIKEIKNEGLRTELLSKSIFIYHDGFMNHYNSVGQIIEDPQNYNLSVLEKTLDFIKEFKHLDNIVKNDKITIVGINDEPKNKK